MGPRFSLLAFLAAGCTFSVRSLPATSDDLAPPDFATPPSSLDDLAAAAVDLAAPLDLNVLPSLSGARGDVAASVDLTTEGKLDWTHFGLAAASDVNRKLGGPLAIAMTPTSAPAQWPSYGHSFTWSDGTPTATANTTAGIFVNGMGNGFAVTVPGDGALHTLALYLTLYQSTAALTAHVDGASDYTDGPSAGNNRYFRYTFAFRAPAGGSLKVSWMLMSDQGAGSGSVDLLAATLY